MIKVFFIPLFFVSPLFGEETQPTPEYPYPSETKGKSFKDYKLEKPKRIDNQGVYYYSKKRKKETAKSSPLVEAPHRIDSDGTYYYSKRKKKKQSTFDGVEKPKYINSKGEAFYYDDDFFEYNSIFSIHGGIYKPPQNQFVFERSYRDRHSNDWPLPFWPLVFKLDYERKLIDSLFIRGEFGWTSFKARLLEEDATREFYSVSLLPLSLSLSYKFSFRDFQYLTPYLDAGAGTLFEVFKADTNKEKKNPTLLSTGFGFLISLSKFQSDKSSFNELGINQSWINIQYRKVFDLSNNCPGSSCIDFDSDIITAGFAFGFGKSSKTKKPEKFHKNNPVKTNKQGDYFYGNDQSTKTNKIVSLLAGTYGPPDIKSTREGSPGYREIYSDKEQFIFRFEFDWRLFDWRLGAFFLKLASGFTNASGNGRFLNDSQNGKPKERFNFYLFPTTLSLSYKLKLWNTQYLIPYLDTGMGYFGFAEYRSDGKKTHFGGGGASSFGFGLLVRLTKHHNEVSLLNEHGITNIWLNLQYQQVIGLDERKDFSSDMVNVGFSFGF